VSGLERDEKTGQDFRVEVRADPGGVPGQLRGQTYQARQRDPHSRESPHLPVALRAFD